MSLFVEMVYFYVCLRLVFIYHLNDLTGPFVNECIMIKPVLFNFRIEN